MDDLQSHHKADKKLPLKQKLGRRHLYDGFGLLLLQAHLKPPKKSIKFFSALNVNQSAQPESGANACTFKLHAFSRQ